MEKCDATNTDEFEIKDIPVGSMVYVKVIPADEDDAYAWYSELKIGDVLTFRYVYASQETITHRIVDIEEKDDKTGFIIKLQGDNKNSESGVLTQTIDTSLKNSPNYVIGKVMGQSRLLGLIVTVLKSAVGIICVVILPCLAIVIYEIVKIVKVITHDKRKKTMEENARRDSELEALKRRLAELEAKSSSDGDEKSL